MTEFLIKLLLFLQKYYFIVMIKKIHGKLLSEFDVKS